MHQKFYIHTFGCQMNVHDSGKMAGLLQGMGYEEAASGADADIILFNTCTVREHAHHKAISEIGRVVHMKKKRPRLIVGVCGCAAQEERERLFEIYPELDIVFGPDQIHRLPELLDDIMPHASCLLPRQGEARSMKHEAGKVIATELVDDPDEYNWKYLMADIHPLPHPPPSRGREGERGRVSVFVTIMKGCNNNCSFCIVPRVRGREVNRPADDVIEEIKRLARGGVKEVTLLGQNVNSYSHTLSPSPQRGEGVAPLCKGGEGGISSFVQLLRRITEETPILRIRYTSPHPKDLGDDLIEEHAVNPKLCRHMHLPLQAGSDNVLRAMKRSYNKKQFIERILKLRKRVDGIDITTDVIVGFPGETEKDYQETLEVVREAAFDGMYAFKYSPRPGTRAAELQDDVPLKEKDDRLRHLLELNAAIWKEKTQRLVGSVQQVLVEGVSKKHILSFEPSREDKMRSSSRLGNARSKNNHVQLTGRTFANKIVNFAGNLNLVGHIVPIRIVSAGPNSLKGGNETMGECWPSANKT